MPDLSSTSAPGASWRIDGRRVDLVADCRLAGGAHVDLERPAAGLATQSGDHVLGLDLDAACAATDVWVRGADLTAAWQADSRRGLKATSMWRCRCAAAPAGVTAWELVASATTALPHADSTLAVTSDVAADTILSAVWQERSPAPFSTDASPRRGLVLLRRGDGTSALLLVHPDDHQAVTVERRSGRARLACWLFPTGVEKGVLLRSRVMAAIGPAAGDTEWARELALGFAASPPFLDT